MLVFSSFLLLRILKLCEHFESKRKFISGLSISYRLKGSWVQQKLKTKSSLESWNSKLLGFFLLLGFLSALNIDV